MSGQECGVFKEMMLLSLPPHGRCRQWEQTGIQTLEKGNQRLGLTARGSKRSSAIEVNILPPLACVQCYLEGIPFPDKESQHKVLGSGLHAWELGRRGDLGGEGLGC